MEIGGFSPVAMSAANVMNDISIKVLSQNLDTMESLGNGIAKILEMSVSPLVGGNFDVRL